MRYPKYLTPGTMTLMLILGLIVGTIMFKVVLTDELKDVIKDFPTDKAIATTGLVYVVLYAIWAKRKEKKDELEYRKNLQTSLEMLEDSKKKK